MKHVFKDYFRRFKNDVGIPLKISAILLFIFIVYLGFNYYYLYRTSREEIDKKLSSVYAPILADIKYNNGKWDTGVYIADSDIPYDNPIYIYTSDGFLIDRANIINGFLDKSDFTFANSFVLPQDYTSIINENWRILSKPIIFQGIVRGTILVGYFEPQKYELRGLDVDLKDGANEISDTLNYQKGILNTNLENKNIKFDGSYEIVDRYNNLIKGLGGLPSYLDPSLINNVQINKAFVVYDKKTKNQFTLVAKPIVNNGKKVGVVIVGTPTTLVNQTLFKELKFSIISAIIAIIIFGLLSIYPLRKDIEKKIKKEMQDILEPKPEKLETISFNLENSYILINNHSKIDVPYDSDSYYLCKVFFCSKRKNWQLSSLLNSIDKEKTEENWRKVYDPVRKINEKVRAKTGLDLVTMISHRYYKINPQIAPYIAS